VHVCSKSSRPLDAKMSSPASPVLHSMTPEKIQGQLTLDSIVLYDQGDDVRHLRFQLSRLIHSGMICSYPSKLAVFRQVTLHEEHRIRNRKSLGLR